MFNFYKNAINHGSTRQVTEALNAAGRCRDLSDDQYGYLLQVARWRWAGE